ncbi:hypothetical protein C806_03112 [Lachnospiraceae bacterium 3-1]|nr:hypothetical protein C806_03112 [Lachnospiraceae bacterium 3-1]
MKITCVQAVFFSPTGTTKYIVTEIARQIAEKLNLPFTEHNVTLPKMRQKTLVFGKDQLVIVGIPVYAGRAPNKILPFFQEQLKGNDALAIPIVTFGNRSYDNALIELRNELEHNNFHTIAAAAFATQHAFSEKLAHGRPDSEDIRQMTAFAEQVASKSEQIADLPTQILVRGEEPIPAYYTPLDMDGKPAVFLKAKPKTMDTCTDCGICANVCPMGSIDAKQSQEVSGICIKCQACVKYCPEHAKYFDDPAFLSHVKMLEHHYTRRAENELFLN